MEGRNPGNGKEENTRPKINGGGIVKIIMKRLPSTW
jgi:hypothetical protein